jgi:uncharacterized membrane protein
MTSRESMARAKTPGESPAPHFDMEILIGYILLGGVLASVGLLVTGLLWHRVRVGDWHFDYALKGGNLSDFLLNSLDPITSGGMRPRVLVNLGVCALLLTPYLRVLASLLYFMLVKQNWKYTLITSLVFLTLTYSLFIR